MAKKRKKVKEVKVVERVNVFQPCPRCTCKLYTIARGCIECGYGTLEDNGYDEIDYAIWEDSHGF